MIIGQIDWIHVERALPDSDTTVLVFCPAEDEPVWIGYHDGERWIAVGGEPIEVTHWRDIPEPPGVES